VRRRLRELTDAGHFDEDGVEAGGDHVGQQGALVEPPQVGQRLQAQAHTPGWRGRERRRIRGHKRTSQGDRGTGSIFIKFYSILI